MRKKKSKGIKNEKQRNKKKSKLKKSELKKKKQSPLRFEPGENATEGSRLPQ